MYNELQSTKQNGLNQSNNEKSSIYMSIYVKNYSHSKDGQHDYNQHLSTEYRNLNDASTYNLLSNKSISFSS